jgi:hypothetical protein
VRTPVDVAVMMPTVKAAIFGPGNEQPIYGVRTMKGIVSESVVAQRIPMILLGCFGGLALLLAHVISDSRPTRTLNCHHPLRD